MNGLFPNRWTKDYVEAAIARDGPQELWYAPFVSALDDPQQGD